MKTEQIHIDQIKTAFHQMQSKNDLLALMNTAKKLIFGEDVNPFELKQLTWFANPKLAKKRYTTFTIKKKSGAERSIHAPVKGLKALQKTLSFILQCVYEPHKAAMGFVRDKSIVDNAIIHVGNKYVFNTDLKDFFPSIDQARVWKCLQLAPFNLNKASTTPLRFIKWVDFKTTYLNSTEKVSFLQGKGKPFATVFIPNEENILNGQLGNFHYSKTGKVCTTVIYFSSHFDSKKEIFVLVADKNLSNKSGENIGETLWMVNKIPQPSKLDVANIIASICCTEMEVERKNKLGEWEKVKRNVLPQGAPTSPVITNIVCQRLDYLLSGVAKRFGLKYSRYADDITFSSMHNVYQQDGEFLKELQRIIAEQNFHIKESKTRLQKDGYRKEVTGLLVNDKVNVQQRYIKQLRMWLYYWETYGYERAYKYFLQKYISNKGHVKNGNPDMPNVIAGKLDYLKMVKGEENKLWLALKERFDKLHIKTNQISTILEIWEKKGIDAAITIYNKNH